MKKSIILIVVLSIIGVFTLLGLGVFMYGISVNNKMVSMEESVSAQWAQVENVYQRRADLIPNLVNTVKGYANFEQKTLTDVIEARSKATSVNIDPSNLNASNIQQFEAAQQGLSSALSRLMVVVERYPDLKANQNFLELQTQLERTENRIAVERRGFNNIVRTYNSYIKKVPQRLIAGWYGFEEKAYFKAAEGSEKAPEVQF